MIYEGEKNIIHDTELERIKHKFENGRYRSEDMDDIKFLIKVAEEATSLYEYIGGIDEFRGAETMEESIKAAELFDEVLTEVYASLDNVLH